MNDNAKYVKMIQLRKERRIGGLCIDCGLAATPGRSTCVNCRRSDTARRAGIVAQRRTEGLCVCKQPLLSSGQVCETCWYRLKAQKATGLGRAGWSVLKSLLEAQGFQCDYTGERLQVGDQRATIDHKIPTSRGGDDSIDNLHWVTKRMNEVKGSLTHDEFLTVCRKVTNRHQPAE